MDHRMRDSIVKELIGKLKELPDGCRITTRQLLKLAGLDPEENYRDTESGKGYGGDELMLKGLPVPASWKDYASCQIWLEKC